MLVIGKIGQGVSTFILLLLNKIKQLSGHVLMNSTISFLPEKFFFTRGTVLDNIQFFDRNISKEKIKQLSRRLGLKD